MKFEKYILAGVLFFLFAACDEDNDRIPLEDLEDVSPPEVTIIYPTEGAVIEETETITPIDFEFVVTDDIEITSIKIYLNGEKIDSLENFKDYRRVIQKYHYKELATGEHKLKITATDISEKTTSDSVSFLKIEPYQPVYEGEIFYMPFDGDYQELVSKENAIEIGNPGFAVESVKGGNAYAGAEGSYLIFPAEKLTNEEFSAVFWIKVNTSFRRAGILVIAPPDEDEDEDEQNNRTSGFRFFREGNSAIQTFKLNVGTGFGDTWFDGGSLASVFPAFTDDWIHIGFTISGSRATIFINGRIVSQANFEGVDWANCDILSIGSGAPRFTSDGHLSDESYLDELRIFDKALLPEEIRMIMDNEKE